MEINIDNLTLAEAEEVETITGIPIEQIGAEGKPKVKILRALCFITMKRENPSITWEDTANIKIQEVNVTSDTDPKGQRSRGSKPRG